MLNEAKAKKITKRVLGLKTVDELGVRIESRTAGNTRFARNEVTTNGDVETLSVTVEATQAGRTATVRGSAVDDAALAQLVKDAEALAALAPVDPEHMPPLGPQNYGKSTIYDNASAKLDAADRVARVESPVTRGRAETLQASGFFANEVRAVALANSAGAFCFEASTEASLSSTFRTLDGSGSGRAVAVSHAIGNIDAAAVAQRAADKAARSANPRDLDPGDYTVILEPQAVWDLMSFLLYSMSSRAAQEGRSWFSAGGGQTKLGRKLFSDSIHLFSDPGDADNPASVVSPDGQPQLPRTWIRDGVLETLTRTRYWAKAQKAEAVPAPSSLHLEGSKTSLDALVSGVQRGVLVTRFWYNRMLEPRSILATGLTRDGTFWVENGKISHAVKNFRYNDSPLTLLTKVRALGAAQRVETRGGLVAVMPSMVVDGFHFESRSDAV